MQRVLTRMFTCLPYLICFYCRYNVLTYYILTILQFDFGVPQGAVPGQYSLRIHKPLCVLTAQSFFIRSLSLSRPENSHKNNWRHRREADKRDRFSSNWLNKYNFFLIVVGVRNLPVTCAIFFSVIAILITLRCYYNSWAPLRGICSVGERVPTDCQNME